MNPVEVRCKACNRYIGTTDANYLEANATSDVAPLHAVVERAHEVPRPANALPVEPVLKSLSEWLKDVERELRFQRLEWYPTEREKLVIEHLECTREKLTKILSDNKSLQAR